MYLSSVCVHLLCLNQPPPPRASSPNVPLPVLRASDPELVKKWATDTNAVALDKGVEAIGALVRQSGIGSARSVSRLSSPHRVLLPS